MPSTEGKVLTLAQAGRLQGELARLSPASDWQGSPSRMCLMLPDGFPPAWPDDFGLGYYLPRAAER